MATERYDEALGDYVVEAAPMPWSVRRATPREDHTLLVAFADGTERVLRSGEVTLHGSCQTDGHSI